MSSTDTSPIIFKKLDERATIPTRGTPNSVGLDLSTIEYVETEKLVYVHTGLAVQPPVGYFFEIHARSSLHKSGWMLANSVGIIDPDYRGELVIALKRIGTWSSPIQPNTRIAQLVLKKSDLHMFPIVEGELSTTERGSGGFGSTGQSTQ